METKKYWQSMDDTGRTELYKGEKPARAKSLDGARLFQPTNTSTYVTTESVFPIPLKPLQIAEITVNENGTWSYEIEREEGWYMARAKATNAVYPLQYKCGIWYSGIGNRIDAEPFTISQTRIPDECII